MTTSPCVNVVSVCGLRGLPGPGATINVRPAIVTPAGTNPEVENLGTLTYADLQFSLPASGAPGVGIAVENVPALRNVQDPLLVGVVTVLGCSDADDGGGGLWRWDATSTADDNTGTVAISNFDANGRWLRVYSGPVNVRWFGATGDGVTDDSAAIQAAIDLFISTYGSGPNKGNIVFVPEGTYLINAALNLYSAIHFVGVGVTSVLLAGPDLTDRVINLTALYNPEPSVRQYRFGRISDFRFITTGDVWAIRSGTYLVLNSIFERILLNTAYGLGFFDYTQACTISQIVSRGPINQILYLFGNFNHIEHIDKEDETGSSSEPYIHLSADYDQGFSNQGNSLKHILIEGAGSANKTVLKLTGTRATTLEKFWNEVTVNNGYSIELDNSSIEVWGQNFNNTLENGKLKLRNTSYAVFDFVSAVDATYDWEDRIDADDSSFCRIKMLETPLGRDTYKISSSDRIVVDELLNQRFWLHPVAGWSPTSKPNYVSGQNLFVNPSFEAGMYGWNEASGAASLSVAASEVAQGLMLVSTNAGGVQIYQTIAISAEQVGMPLTLRYVAKATGSGLIVPVFGAATQTNQNCISAGEGWQVMTATYRPQAAGNLDVGVWLLGTSAPSNTLYVDEMSLCFGEEGVINSAKFGSFELNNKTMTYATAAPSTGTWKVGDRIFNSAPAVGQPKGWICTVAGTPGTWVSEGNL